MFVGCLAFVGSLVVPVLIFCLGSLHRYSFLWIGGSLFVNGFLRDVGSLTNLGMLVSFGSLSHFGFLIDAGPIMTRVCVRDIVPDTAGALPILQSFAMLRKGPSRTS
jgi:hypothetical protein